MAVKSFITLGPGVKKVYTPLSHQGQSHRVWQKSEGLAIGREPLQKGNSQYS
jgi:hypothetical protein